MQDGRANARPASVTAGDLDTGARIGRYLIIERVGTGAMGVVYGAYDPELDRKVALKLLKPGQGVKDTARARLLREAKAMARLAHPNVVAVHDVGVFEDQVFLAMEFVGGGTLKSWLGREAALVARDPRRVRRGRAGAWRPRTPPGSCTATSSRTTCSSTRKGGRASSTSASRARRAPATTSWTARDRRRAVRTARATLRDSSGNARRSRR